jgi:tetratricopeptide (TPR) repeat protein
MSDYSKALSFHEKALDIRQKSLPPHYPRLTSSHSYIGGAYAKMGNSSKALLFFERALDIGQRSLPANHSDLQTYRMNVETFKKCRR